MGRGVAAIALFAAALASVAAPAAAEREPRPARVSLIGLDPANVERRIGPPDDRNDLPDSDEAYWTYHTKAGTLTVHFQNDRVVDIDPSDFPIETILR